jgi:hypothetical protein
VGHSASRSLVGAVVSPRFFPVSLWSNFNLLTRPKAERLESLNVEVPLTPQQAFAGGEVCIMVPARLVCPACRGHGGVGPYECSRCEGQGAVSGEYPMRVNYPAGLQGTIWCVCLLTVSASRIFTSPFDSVRQFRCGERGPNLLPRPRMFRLGVTVSTASVLFSITGCVNITTWRAYISIFLSYSQQHLSLIPTAVCLWVFPALEIKFSFPHGANEYRGCYDRA